MAFTFSGCHQFLNEPCVFFCIKKSPSLWDLRLHNSSTLPLARLPWRFCASRWCCREWRLCSASWCVSGSGTAQWRTAAKSTWSRPTIVRLRGGGCGTRRNPTFRTWHRQSSEGLANVKCSPLPLRVRLFSPRTTCGWSFKRSGQAGRNEDTGSNRKSRWVGSNWTSSFSHSVPSHFPVSTWRTKGPSARSDARKSLVAGSTSGSRRQSRVGHLESQRWWRPRVRAAAALARQENVSKRFVPCLPSCLESPLATNSFQNALRCLRVLSKE